MVSVYLIAVLLVLVRRAKKLLQLHNKKYYFTIVLYIASKIVICAILLIQIIAGIRNDWADLSPDHVEIMLKNAIALADMAVIELFLIGL